VGYSSGIMDPASSLRGHAAKNPQKTALICGDSAATYQALDESSTLLAWWFLNRGLHPGDCVAIHWSNSIEAVQLLFALFKARLIAVTVNIRLKPAEIGFILDHSNARMCFSEPALAPTAGQAGAQCPIFTQLPPLGIGGVHSTMLPPVHTDQRAVILYTSGTTARPKGVVHTHRSLCNTAVAMAQIVASELLDFNEIGLCVLPVMHMAALSGVLASVYLGASIVLLPRFDPTAVLEAIERFKCTNLTCMPALWQFVVEEQARKPRRVSSLRTAVAAGDTVPVALQDRFKKLFGIPLLEGYGLTEAVPITCNPKTALRPGSIGVRMEGFEVRIVGVYDRDVPEGETGEIVVRSAANCIGYWDDPEATRSLMSDGWLHTGDLGCRDADGYYWFKGRSKEIIIRAGSNISPQEVEEALYQHLAVLEAGVVGAPDPVYGELVIAFVALREGQTADQEALRDFARQRLADYKVPERIIFLDQLPKGPTGKVQRRMLKEILSAKPDASGTRP
jgi:long-chain acyl-CoA synthetase